ncbi:MAG: SDR family oxidoreductase [Clostridia bacterium]|nr:SDR family oxidoreductase [Clostridia bacterium]
MEYDFSGKVALITGAASGMGKLTGENVIAAGGKVIAIDITPIEETDSLCYANCDVRDYAQIDAAVKRGIERFGRIDFLCNFAGGDGIRILQGVRDFATVDPAILGWEIDVNLRAQLWFARAVMPYMVEQKSGVILNVGSIAGLKACGGSVGYSSAKAGAIFGLTKSLAQYGGPRGIRVNCISPGPVLTRAAMANMKTLLGRAAEPQEIVDLVMYLLSDKSSFCTGSNFTIDGGHVCLH